MRPFTPGEDFFTLIKSAVPDFVESEYPLFVEFLMAFMRFLEQPRSTASESIFPEFGGSRVVESTTTMGGPLYEARKMLEYRDVSTSLTEFTSHFQQMFARNFPQYAYVSPELFIQSLRQFYQAKGTPDSFKWFFRILFNKDADVYFPRESIFKASDATWSAPFTLKVSAPINSLDNRDVERYYVGQRIVTETGSALVDRVTVQVVGQQFNQYVVVNELFLKYKSLSGTFTPGQTVRNIDSATTITTTILPIITGVRIGTGGSNYVPGDIVTFSEGPSGGYGYGAEGIVRVVNDDSLSGVEIISGGDGYITGLPVNFTSSSGSGASAIIDRVVYGEILLEDGSGYLACESSSSGLTENYQLEDKNTINLELILEDFAGVSANVAIDAPDYGAASGVTQLDERNIDSEISLVLAAVDEKPFMHPWVFLTGNTVALANAAATLQLNDRAYFSNNATVFAIGSATDILTDVNSAVTTARVIVSDVTVGQKQDVLYLDTFVNENLLDPRAFMKESSNGIAQTGKITTTIENSANVVGIGTSFKSVIGPGSHVRFHDGTQIVVRAVANDTFFTTHGTVTLQKAEQSWSVVPVGQIIQYTPQSQVFYGKIKSIQLLTQGSQYATAPLVSADSVSARAQEISYLDGNTLEDANGQIRNFIAANLSVTQAFGQVTRVDITNTGVNYTVANDVTITTHHSDGRIGANAQMTPILGALSQQPGEFTTTRSFASSDNYLQDATFYNDYTYVIRVGESFDRYRNLVLSLLHPAGFQLLGHFLSVDAVELQVESINAYTPYAPENPETGSGGTLDLFYPDAGAELELHQATITDYIGVYADDEITPFELVTLDEYHTTLLSTDVADGLDEPSSGLP